MEWERDKIVDFSVGDKISTHERQGGTITIPDSSPLGKPSDMEEDLLRLVDEIETIAYETGLRQSPERMETPIHVQEDIDRKANISEVFIHDEETYISKDASGNMTFTDIVAGTRYLKNLGCPTYKFIKATSRSEGDLHLSDGTNWAVSKTIIKWVRIETSSTDWDLYILQNDNGYATDDANIPKLQIMEAGNGDQNIYLDLPYEDEDSSNEVHLYYLDNSGANTADIYIIGYEMV